MPLTSGTPAAPLGPRGLASILGWRRVAFTLTLSTLIALALSNHWEQGPLVGLIRVVPLGFMAMLTFGLFEQWPKRLPRWLARWVLQVMGVALIIPIVTTAIYVLSTPSGAPRFDQVPARMAGYTALTLVGLLLAPWAALTALVRQKDALARNQALPADDPADPRGERGASRCRPERGGRPHRDLGAPPRRPVHGPGERHGRGTEADGRRPGHGAHDAARAPAVGLRRRCAHSPERA